MIKKKAASRIRLPMLVYTRQKNIAQASILERYFFVSIYPAAIPGTYLAVFLVAALLLCL